MKKRVRVRVSVWVRVRLRVRGERASKPHRAAVIGTYMCLHTRTHTYIYVCVPRGGDRNLHMHAYTDICIYMYPHRAAVMGTKP